MHEEPKDLYEPRDVGNEMRAIGSPCTTSGAVTKRVRTGWMRPTHRTIRGVVCWTKEGLDRELYAEGLRLALRRQMQLRGYDVSRIQWWPKDPVQLELAP